MFFLFLILFVGSKLGNNVFYLLAPLVVVISELKINETKLMAFEMQSNYKFRLKNQ